MKHIRLTPVPKPRMVKSDTWRKRKCVLRYWEFKDALTQAFGDEVLPVPATIVFLMPMPQSWSNKKRSQLDGQPHLAKPDTDNLIKAVQDCLCANDSHLWDMRAIKYWTADPIGGICILPSDPLPDIKKQEVFSCLSC